MISIFILISLLFAWMIHYAKYTIIKEFKDNYLNDSPYLNFHHRNETYKRFILWLTVIQLSAYIIIAIIAMMGIGLIKV
jgi:hypothetical protein